jgi:hypothetical protein
VFGEGFLDAVDGGADLADVGPDLGLAGSEGVELVAVVDEDAEDPVEGLIYPVEPVTRIVFHVATFRR